MLMILLFMVPSARADVLAAGAFHSLAVKDDGTVWSWGGGGHNELGYSGQNVTPPRQVPGLSGIVAVAAAYYYSAALDNEGRVWWWGNQQATPILITNSQFQSVQAIAVQQYGCGSSGNYLYGIKKDGSVVVLDLLQGTVTSVAGLSGPVQSFVPGMNPYAFVVMADKSLSGWTICSGDTFFPSVFTARSLSQANLTFSLGNVTGSANANNGLDTITQPSGDISILKGFSEWNGSTSGSTPRYSNSSNGPYASVYANGDITFALDAGGNLYGWSDLNFDYLGALGNPDAILCPSILCPPVTFSSWITNVKTVAVSDNDFVLAETTDGRVWGWGANFNSETGQPATAACLNQGEQCASEPPTPIPGFSLITGARSIPAITLTKTVDKASAISGTTLTYTIAYQNTGTAAATNFVIKDIVPAGLTVGTINNGGTSSTSGGITTIMWTIGGTIPAGGSGSVSFVATVQ
jgi:uncharacterized repeat protein (TIGR01451 family)